MRLFLAVLVVLAASLPVLADAETEKSKPQKIKIAYILSDTKAAIMELRPPVTLRLFRGMPFEYLSKVPNMKKVYYRVRFVNGETLTIKGAQTALKLMVVKLPSPKKQKEIYKDMQRIPKIVEVAARRRASGMSAQSLAYFKRKYTREVLAGMVRKYGRHGLTYSTWQKIKAAGDAGWPKQGEQPKK